MHFFAASVSIASSASSAPVAPAAVTEQLAALKQINRFASLPAAIQTGQFTVDGVSAKGWQMAEPGGKFSATDVPVPGAPGRRLIFAACDARLCLIHYERGGIAHFYEILALASTPQGWRAVWNVRGSKPIASFDALRIELRNGALPATWSAQAVKGDF
ncbi:MAG TPA: hypothetical protein VKR05_05690 [Candidatus Cybelea sp.]|nr:hypothetical protein [Candidatus Cybelea sp.]